MSDIPTGRWTYRQKEIDSDKSVEIKIGKKEQSELKGNRDRTAGWHTAAYTEIIFVSVFF